MIKLININLQEFVVLSKSDTPLKEKQAIIKAAMERSSMNSVPNGRFIQDIKVKPSYGSYINLELKLSGRRYKYYNVSKNRLTRFMNTEQKGTFYNRSIKGKFKMRRLKRTDF